MISDSQLDSVLRAALKEDANRAVGSSNVTGQVRARMVHARHWHRAVAVPSSLAAVLLVGAVVLAATSELSIVLRYHPIGWLPTPGKLTAVGPCSSLQGMALADVQRRVNFRVLTLGGATLVNAYYGPPCPGSSEANAHLLYEENGESFDLGETHAPEGPITVDLKGTADRSPWRIVTVNGNDYAVLIFDDAVTAAAFKQAGTRVDITVGAKGGPNRPLSLDQFEELVLQIN
jgi:hypothetical protein